MIVERAAGRDLTRAGMIEILISAGYTRSSATGRMSSSHPLFERVGPEPLPPDRHADRTRSRRRRNETLANYVVSAGGSSGS